MATSPNDHTFDITTEHEVLCEMNADFHRSKVELIHRFLSDQEELNKRFAEYALNTDEDSSENEGNAAEAAEYICDMLRTERRTKPRMLTEEDILQDMECRSFLDDDNLSTTSAINSSLGAGSDIAVLEEESALDGEFHLSREGNTILKDQNGNFSRSKVNRSGKGVLPSKAYGRSRHGDLSPSRTARREENPNRKPKKLLVKKNVRPQTAAGIRRGANLLDETELLQQRLEDEQSPITVALPQGYTQHPMRSRGSPRSTTRIRTSWLEEHPDIETVSFRKLSDSACRHSPVAFLPHGEPVFMDRNAFQRARYDKSSHLVGNGVQFHPSEIASRNKSDGHFRNFAGNGKGLLSINISPNKDRIHPRTIPSRLSTPLGDRHGVDGRISTCSDRCSPGSSRTRQPHRSDTTSKRKITVLKLPPLDGSMAVNKSTVDHERIMRDAPKGNVTPATEFMAG